MENQVTSSNKTPDEIEREMLETRESITEKVAALENQVVGTLQTAANTVNGTVEAVKSLITHAPEAVSDSIKQATSTVKEVMGNAFNISEHVERYPWASVGTATLLGCITGWLVSRPSGSSAAEASMATAMAAPAAASTPTYRAPGIFDKVLEMLGDRVKELAETAVSTVSESIKGTIQEKVPTLIDQAASHLTEPSPEVPYPPTSGRRFGSESGTYSG